MEECWVCGVVTAKPVLEWNAEAGWCYVCHDHRMVPRVAGPGQWHFVRVGG